MQHAYDLRSDAMKRRLEELRLENIVGAMSLAMVDKMEQAFAAETGRGPSAVAALMQIGVEPGLSIERLRRIIALSHSASVRLVDQLVAEGLVRRETSTGSDKRARALYLTAQGKTLFDAARAARGRITQAALARLSGEERRMLDGIVAKMFPALVGPDDDDEVVCRLCDETVCPMERCPVPQHHSS
jgi:MarR family transcriptional regulator, negative regulator of the multidrug operon emrRAB